MLPNWCVLESRVFPCVNDALLPLPNSGALICLFNHCCTYVNIMYAN